MNQKTKLVLIQTRIREKDAKKLRAAQKKAGVLSQASFLRQIILASLEEQSG